MTSSEPDETRRVQLETIAVTSRGKSTTTRYRTEYSLYADSHRSPCALVVRAMWDFAGSAAGDLPFKKGDIITVRKKIDAGWWEGTRHRYRESACEGDSERRTGREIQRQRHRVSVRDRDREGQSITLPSFSFPPLLSHPFRSLIGELNGKTGLFPVPYVLELGAPPSNASEPPLSQTRPKWGLDDVKGFDERRHRGKDRDRDRDREQGQQRQRATDTDTEQMHVQTPSHTCLPSP